jgi:hypothetical protein
MSGIREHVNVASDTFLQSHLSHFSETRVCCGYATENFTYLFIRSSFMASENAVTACPALTHYRRALLDRVRSVTGKSPGKSVNCLPPCLSLGVRSSPSPY